MVTDFVGRKKRWRALTASGLHQSAPRSEGTARLIQGRRDIAGNFAQQRCFIVLVGMKFYGRVGQARAVGVNRIGEQIACIARIQAIDVGHCSCCSK